MLVSVARCLLFSWLATLGSLALAEADPETPWEDVRKTPELPNALLPIQIKSYAAVGDSYAAGVGAGPQIDAGCWLYADSYPGQLNRSNLLPGDHRFQFLACSGVRMQAVDTYLNRAERKERKTVDQYIDKVEDATFATLSIGGNDVGFFKILNACVYNFYGPFSGSCNETLDLADAIVASDEFTTGYNAALDLLLQKGDSPSFRILATGYSAFFDDALTDDCNEHTLSYWPGWWQNKLTVDVRRRINNVSKSLNAKIGQIINARPDNRVIWVDWAWRFDKHRFCQPGKPPIDSESAWFFDVEFREFIPNEDIDIETCELESQLSGDWEERAACGIAIVRAAFPNATLRGVGDNVDTKGGRDPFAPSTARLFHPTPQGYAAIVEEIRRVWPYY
ncbi:hypothetical protein FQN49_003251 [Arthroderma sp. PD_2]|nr:hypothetical protein FQN49_003251 [Arthroderma sp. PD_2]